MMKDSVTWVPSKITSYSFRKINWGNARSVGIIVCMFLSVHILILFPFIFKNSVYLFLERGEGREKDRERNINAWLPIAYPNWGPVLQPRHVSWLGIKLVTLWYPVQHSIHLSHNSYGCMLVLRWFGWILSLQRGRNSPWRQRFSQY